MMSQTQAALHADVRVGFTLGDPSFDTLLKVAKRWNALLAAEVFDGRSRSICAWAANGGLASEGRTRIPWMCWHDLEVPSSLDRYIRVRRSSDAWSPWGLKSGPNYQFFRLLDRAAQAHHEPWLLLLEVDTFPLGDPAASISDLIERNPKGWMIGGTPHPASEAHLDPTIRGHLNGAALYNLGSSDFSQFRRLVWLPSLLESLSWREGLAFDCVTAPAFWSRLSPELRVAWQDAGKRFVATSGIVNLSTMRLHDGNLDMFLSQREKASEAGETSEGPWMLHAKTDDVQQLMRALARYTTF